MKYKEPVRTEGRRVERTVNILGKEHKLTLCMENLTYETHTSERVERVLNDKGNEVEGLWLWGTYGNLHAQPLEFDMRQGDGYLQFQAERSWCNGRAKNGRRYLRSIVEKQPIK